MILKLLNKIFLLILVLLAFSACVDNSVMLTEYQTTDVVIKGIQAGSSESGLKVISLNRVKREKDETFNTPENIGGCFLSVYYPSNAGDPYISEEIEFVDRNGEDELVIPNVRVGINRFVVESYVDIDKKPFKDAPGGWDGVFKQVKKEGGKEEDKYEKYNKKIERDYSLYVNYRAETSVIIDADLSNDINLNMQPQNGRLAIIIEADKVEKLDILVKGTGGDYTLLKSIKNGKALCILYNYDFEQERQIYIKVIKYKKEKKDIVVDKTIILPDLPKYPDIDLKYESGKYKTQIITVKK